MSVMIPIRVFFKKTGRLKYISHLDMVNLFSRAIQRSKLPIWYTQGYNPRIYISFPFPLSLGYGGTNECFEIRLVEEIDMEELLETLNKVLPEELKVHHAASPKMKPKEVSYGDYHVSFFFSQEDATPPPEILLENMAKKEEIIVEKKSKKGLQKVDIGPYISMKDISGNAEEWVLHLQIATGLNFNINPRLFVEAFEKENNIKLESSAVLRTQLYNDNMEVFQ